MDDTSSRTTLLPIWEQQRSRVLAYGHALHALLPDDQPPITISGRDLRPGDEGVGFQFQYTLSGDLYGGDVTTACFVVQIELVRLRASHSWKIDAAPLLEYRDGHFEVFGRRGTAIGVADKRRVRWFFAEPLTHSATRFFAKVRASAPIDETITTFANGQSPPTQVARDD